jgi:hypothetical protein
MMGSKINAHSGCTGRSSSRPSLAEHAREVTSAHGSGAKEDSDGTAPNWTRSPRGVSRLTRPACKAGHHWHTHGRTQRPPSGVGNLIECGRAQGRTTILPGTRIRLIDLDINLNKFENRLPFAIEVKGGRVPSHWQWVVPSLKLLPQKNLNLINRNSKKSSLIQPASS